MRCDAPLITLQCSARTPLLSFSLILGLIVIKRDSERTWPSLRCMPQQQEHPDVTPVVLRSSEFPESTECFRKCDVFHYSPFSFCFSSQISPQVTLCGTDVCRDITLMGTAFKPVAWGLTLSLRDLHLHVIVRLHFCVY